MRSACLAGVLATALGCGGEPFEYEGMPAGSIPLAVDGWVPAIDVGVDEHAPRRMLVDTGAPLSALDTDAFETYGAGDHDVALTLFGVRVPGHRLSAFDVFPYPQPHDIELTGIVGGDVLRHFALTFDYKARTLDVAAQTDVPCGGRPGPAVAIDLEVRGGGRGSFAGCGACDDVDIPATRLLARVTIESGAPMWMLIDTGASALVLDAHAAASLADDPARPRLDGVTVGTANGNTTAYLTRLGRLALGAAEDHSVAALVLPQEDFLAGLQAETGVEVHGLVGGTVLRNYAFQLDYRQAALCLWRYLEPSHVNDDEYVRVGFAMQTDGRRWHVTDVYAGTDAAREGLVPGDEVAELAGVSLADVGATTVAEALAPFGLGDEVPVTVRRGDATWTAMIAVEDLLPAYPASEAP